MSGHFSWHIMSRGCAYDLVNEHVKSFCREISCRTAPIRALDFTRIDFGWIAASIPTWDRMCSNTSSVAGPRGIARSRCA